MTAIPSGGTAPHPQSNDLLHAIVSKDAAQVETLIKGGAKPSHQCMVYALRGRDVKIIQAVLDSGLTPSKLEIKMAADSKDPQIQALFQKAQG